MLKVVVVEDEELVRKGIVLTVDWAGAGCAVVGEAGPELLTLTGGKAMVQPLGGNGPSLAGVEGLLGGISDKLGAGQSVTIVVQSVLDGRVIGETAYDYAMQRARARG